MGKSGGVPPPEPRPRVSEDLVTREGQLRRSPADERTGINDPELARILDRVGERRRRRTAMDAVGLRRPLGRMDGTVAEPGPVVAPDPDTLPSAATPPTATTTGPAARGPSGRVLSIDQVGPTVRIIRVGRPSSFSYVAGQHVKIGTIGTRRGTYSIASAPHDPHVEVCIKLVPDGRLTPALFQVRPGDELVSDWKAKGSFRFDDRARTHVMVATGAGISPLRSLLRDARRRGLTGPVILLHGASHPDELPYHDEMVERGRTDPNFRYVPTVSRPAAPRSRRWAGATGRVDDLVRAALGGLDTGNTRVYVCGNGGMVKAVAADATGRGFAVSTESFG
jgi:ferredoxin-NADP reductase